VTALIDNSGEVVERYVYDPFGSVTVLDAEWNERSTGSEYGWLYLHQGGRYDVSSGLYHFRYRDYSPTLGRWTTLDPLRYAAAMSTCIEAWAMGQRTGSTRAGYKNFHVIGGLDG
jgi:RHS repeat-associated protein